MWYGKDKVAQMLVRYTRMMMDADNVDTIVAAAAKLPVPCSERPHTGGPDLAKYSKRRQGLPAEERESPLDVGRVSGDARCYVLIRSC